MAVNLKHALDEVIAAHGHAAPVQHLAALVGWQGQWTHEAMRPHVARAAQLLADAAQILANIEADEDEMRKLAGYKK